MTGNSSMKAHIFSAGTVVVAMTIVVAMVSTSQPARAADCPEGGKIRFGVEPYDTAARLVPIYQKIGGLISDKVGCPVEVFVATGYNAEIEAMDGFYSRAKGTTISIIKRLIEAGYVHRPPAKNGKPGRKGVGLTPDGLAKAKRLSECPPENN